MLFRLGRREASDPSKVAKVVNNQESNQTGACNALAVSLKGVAVADAENHVKVQLLVRASKSTALGLFALH